MTNASVSARTEPRSERIAKLVSDHYPTVYRFCVRRLGPELARDAAQETFITAHRTIGRFEQRSTPLTWLLGIANNHCRNVARRSLRQIDLKEIWAVPRSPEQSLINLAALRAAILQLSNEHRETVVMHEIEGLTYEEIAEVLKIPVGTVKSRIHSAFQALRKTLTPQEETLA